MLKAVGKFIDTTPIRDLLSQGEAQSDSVFIEVDRFHNQYDLSEFKFVLRGITESGGEAEVCPFMLVEERTILLKWIITPAFTKEAGTLALDLIAYRYEESADPEEEAPDFLIRYQMPSIQVKGLPDGSHVLDEKSYTSFLLQVRNAAEAFLQQITDKASAIWASITQLQNGVASNSDNIANSTQEYRSLCAELEQRIVPIVILTQSEYESMPASEARTLYVIKDA